MSLKRDKRLYNYIVNTLGISKQMVMDYVNQRLEDLIVKALEGKLESSHLQNLILNRITQMVQEGFSKGQFYSDRTAFEAYVKKQIYLVVEQIVKEQYDIQVHAMVKMPKGTNGEATPFFRRPEEE